MEKNLQVMIEQCPVGVAYYKLLFNSQGQADDFEYLYVNRMYEQLTGKLSEKRKARCFVQIPKINTITPLFTPMSLKVEKQGNC